MKHFGIYFAMGDKPHLPFSPLPPLRDPTAVGIMNTQRWASYVCQID